MVWTSMASGPLAVVDWRRQTAALYAQIRAEPDPRRAHGLWCAVRAGMLKTHPASPVPAAERDAYQGPPVAPYDPALRFEAEVDTDVELRRLEIPTATNGVVPFERIGRLHLPGVGGLDVWWLASYGGGLFVPIKDALAGTQTYGGGRYLIDTVKGADLGGEGRRLVVDLNFAYNPSCAYDPAWACPLAQPGNTVAVAVRAGELYREE
jgi:uncharacterized protein (DUF1684 family)